MRKNDSFTYFNLLILCMWLQLIIKVKVTHQGEDQIKTKVKTVFYFSKVAKDYPSLGFPYTCSKPFIWLLPSTGSIDMD